MALSNMNVYDTARYGSCLNQLVDIAQAAGKVVILETPNPVVDSDNGQQIGSYVQVMREVAQQQRVDVINQYANLEEAFAADPMGVCPDGVHPSQEVYIGKGKFAAARFATFDEPR